MDLALNNLKRLICHKTQTINEPASNSLLFYFWLVTILVIDLTEKILSVERKKWNYVSDLVLIIFKVG